MNFQEGVGGQWPLHSLIGPGSKRIFSICNKQICKFTNVTPSMENPLFELGVQRTTLKGKDCKYYKPSRPVDRFLI
jgi:hypothetical protein